MTLCTTPTARSLATLVCALGLSISAQAADVELAKYAFTSSSLGSSATVNPEWTAGRIVRAGGLQSFPIPGYLIFAAGGSTTEERAVSTNSHIQFTVTPSSGHALDLTQLSFQIAGNSLTTGGGYAVYYSLGTSNFTRFPGASTFPVRGSDKLSGGTKVIDLAAEGTTFQDLTSAVTFRFYAWENSPNTAKGTIDNIVLLGSSQSVSAVPEPETCAMLVAGLVVLGMMKRRRGQAPAAV